MDVVVDAEGSTVLHLLSALHYSEETPTHVDIFRRILAGGVSANVRDFDGNTPLHSVGQHPVLSRLLIEFGADVNAQNGCGETPLHVAFRAGDVQVVRCLIQADADLNVRDDFYNTPFHCDASYHPEWKLLVPDLPQSVVRSDALNVFGARTVFHIMALDDSQPQLAQIADTVTALATPHFTWPHASTASTVVRSTSSTCTLTMKLKKRICSLWIAKQICLP